MLKNAFVKTGAFFIYLNKRLEYCGDYSRCQTGGLKAW